MRRLALSALGPALLALGVSACDLSAETTPDAGTPTGSGTGSGSATGTGTSTGTETGTGTGTGTGAGAPTASYTPFTISDLLANAEANKGKAVEIADAVVVAETHFGTPVAGTFYIQDGSGPGLKVYKAKSANTVFPAVGDKVTVKGQFKKWDGTYEVTGSVDVPFVVVVNGQGGTVTGGAMPPAGSPTLVTNAADYAPGAASAHDEQLGHVLHLTGADLKVTNPTALWSTEKLPDGGVKRTPTGFEITGGVLVQDDSIYVACLKSLDGGVGSLDLSNGIRGVWERYQDYNAFVDGGRSPIVPVLLPLNCADVNR